MASSTSPRTGKAKTYRGLDPTSPIKAQGSTSPQDAELSPAMRRFANKSLRRSSSRIQRWVHDQHSIRSSQDHDSGPDTPDTPDTPLLSSGCHPYLAYPHLNIPSLSVSPPDDVFASRGTSHIPEPEVQHVKRDFQKTLRTATPFAPSTPRKTETSQPSGIFNTPTSLRKINLSLSHTRSPSTTTTTTSQSQTPPRPFIFRRPATATDTVTSRNSVLSTSIFSSKPSRAVSEAVVVPPTTWKPRRTVLGHFLTASEGQTDDSSPPRPSTSSTLTHSSSATYAGNSADAAGTPPKFRPESNHLHAPANYRSTPSLWSLPTDASHMHDPPESTKTLARDREKETSGTLHSLKPPSAGVPGLGSVSNILGSPKRKKKRKLIISGIPLGDNKRYDGVRKWCEGFGEVSSITRNSNGDLHVDFRKAEVAETVCRLHARVFIGSVGSVGLSWFTGKRP